MNNLETELLEAMTLQQKQIAQLAKTHGVIEFLMYAIKKEKEPKPWIEPSLKNP